MLGTGEFGVGWKETLVTELALGSEDFVNRVRRLIKGDRNEQKPVRQLERVPINWQAITEGVTKVWREPWERARRRHGDPGARGGDGYRLALCRDEFAANRRGNWGAQLSGGQ